MHYSQQGYVTVYPPEGGEGWRAEVSTKITDFDVYNWDEGKSTEVPVLGRVTDEEMKDFMREGRAKEFNMYGTSLEGSQTFHVPQ